MYQSVGQLTHLDLDLSSVCNAFCWDCNRHWHRRGVQYQNPLLTTINRTYPFDRLISDLDQLTHIRVVDICGNSGDPFSHPDLASIVEWMVQRWPGVYIEIDTNASLGTQETWQRLARLNQNIRVVFGIDGLEDTNHLYRKNVPWHRLWQNLTHYIDQGGRGTWKCIDFPWNEHQRDRMRDLAKERGMLFRLTRRFSPEDDREVLASAEQHKVGTYPRATRQMPHDEWTQDVRTIIDQWHTHDLEIDPECRSEGGERIYVNHDHRVWPCCYMATQSYHHCHISRAQWKHVSAEFDPDWNSLDHHTFADIIQHPVFQRLETQWESPDLSTPVVCMTQCGRCDRPFRALDEYDIL